MLDVSFQDVNNDDLDDVIIAECMTGIGESGATPFKVAGIYFQKDDEFIELPEFERLLSNNETVDMILEYLKDKEIKLD